MNNFHVRDKVPTNSIYDLWLGFDFFEMRWYIMEFQVVTKNKGSLLLS